MTMGDCRRTIELLAPYVDRKLEADEHAAVDRHLEACPPCRRIAERERGGRLVLQHESARLRAEPLPPGLRPRCEALARQHAERASASRGAGSVMRALASGWRSTIVPSVLGAVLLVFTASALFSIATRRSDAVLAAQLTADHSKCFLVWGKGTESPIDARDVERMLAARYGVTTHVPPSSSAAGVQLIGARRCLYADGVVPHVMYRANGHDLSLYVLNGVSRKPSELVTFGHRSRIWTRNEKTYVLVSSAAAEGLPDATRYMMDEAY
jgi:anti-sigma factor RsiW